MNWVKTLLALLLLGCLADAPYGYYQLVRFLAAAIFAWIAFDSYTRNKRAEAFLFMMLALLFQPFLKISLGRELWNVIDVVVAVGLLISLIKTSGRGGTSKD